MADLNKFVEEIESLSVVELNDLVKLIEEKSTRDKLWKIEVTVRNSAVEELHSKMAEVSHHYVPVGKNTKFEFYCETQAESKMVKDIVKEYGAKYFVAESKIL